MSLHPEWPESGLGDAVPFQGKSKPYIIETHRSERRKGFTAMPQYEELIEEAKAIYSKVYPNRDRELSLERVKQTFSHPRTVLQLVKYGGMPVGWGVFPMLDVAGEQVVNSSRAFLPEHEGEGLGTWTLRQGIWLQQKAVLQAHHKPIRWGSLMTQNAISVLTLEKLTDLIEEDFPFGKLYSEDREAQSLMLGVHALVYINSQGIDAVTGVSWGELSEIGENENNKPSKSHEKAWAIHNRMVSRPPKGFGVNREAGDVVYILYRLRKLDLNAILSESHPEVSDKGGELRSTMTESDKAVSDVGRSRLLKPRKSARSALAA